MKNMRRELILVGRGVEQKQRGGRDMDECSYEFVLHSCLQLSLGIEVQNSYMRFERAVTAD